MSEDRRPLPNDYRRPSRTTLGKHVLEVTVGANRTRNRIWPFVDSLFHSFLTLIVVGILILTAAYFLNWTSSQFISRAEFEKKIGGLEEQIRKETQRHDHAVEQLRALQVRDKDAIDKRIDLLESNL